MNNELNEVLKKIVEEYKGSIAKGSRNYLEVDIGKKAAGCGYEKLAGKFDGVNAIVPLSRPMAGMKVRIDGRTFVNYAQVESGIAVPGYVAEAAGLPREAFIPNDSMILNFV